jgi:hypothetical protein
MNKEEKLFDDTEFVQENRPKKITEQQELAFYQEKAEECIELNYTSNDVESVIEDLKSLRYGEDGFQKAKQLNHEGICDYEFSGDFIDWLGWLDSDKHDILRENVKLWVEAKKPQRKFEKGDKLTVIEPFSRLYKKGDIIFITGVRETEAIYTVDALKERQGGYLFEYEEIESHCELFEEE